MASIETTTNASKSLKSTIKSTIINAGSTLTALATSSPASLSPTVEKYATNQQHQQQSVASPQQQQQQQTSANNNNINNSRKSVNIKTKSIENTLLPLINQVIRNKNIK